MFGQSEGVVPGTDYEIPVRGWWQAGLAKKFLLSFFLLSSFFFLARLTWGLHKQFALCERGGGARALGSRWAW